MPDKKDQLVKFSLDGTDFVHLGSVEKLESMTEQLETIKDSAQKLGPALQNLQFKLSADLPNQGLSQLLTLLTGLSEKEVALAGKPDPDWDPKDHPKDHLGKFVKKGTGTFLWGKTKTAKFKLEGTPVTKTLQPGQKLTIVSKENGKQWAVTEDENGNLEATHLVAGKLETAPISADSNIGKAVLPDEVAPAHLKAEVIQTAPTVEVSAGSAASAKAVLNAATNPDGTKKPIVDIGGGKKITLEKNQVAYKLDMGVGGTHTVILTDGDVDDVFIDNGTQLADEHVPQKSYTNLIKKKGEFVADGKGTFAMKEVKTGPTSGDPGTGLPEGSVVEVGSSGSTWKKNPTGTWSKVNSKTHVPTGGHPITDKVVAGLIANGEATVKTDQGSPKIGTPQEAPIGTQAKHPTGTVYTKSAANVWSYGKGYDATVNDASMTGLFDMAKQGSPGFSVTYPPEESSEKAQTKQFVHPQSGETALDVVEVHQHKTSTNSYLVKTASGTWLFFDKNGKVKNASEQIHLKYLGTNYKKLKGSTTTVDSSLADKIEAKLNQAMPKGSNPYASLPVGSKVQDKKGDWWTKIDTSAGEVWESPSGSMINDTQMQMMLPTPSATTPAQEQPKPTGPQTSGTYTLPNGVAVDIKPGVAVYESNGHYVVFNPDGSGTKYYKNGTSSTHVGKKDLYKNWNTVAEGPSPKLTAPDLSSVQPDSWPKDKYGHYTYLQNRQAKLAALTVGKFNYAHKTTIASADSPFALGKDPSEAVALLASPEFQNLVDKTAVTLAAIGKQAGLEKTDKMSIGKDRSRWEFLGTLSRFAQKLQDVDSDEAEIDAEWAAIAAKLGAKHNVTFGADTSVPNTIHSKLSKAVQSWKFKQGIKDLGFDPDTASLETLQKYATDNGFPAVGGLTEQSAKTWVKAKLGDPSIDGDPATIQKAVLDEAHLKIASASAAMFLKQQAKAPDPKKLEAHEKAIKAQQKALIAQAKNLHSLYTNEQGQELAKVGTDSWNLPGKGHITDAQALELVAAGGWKPKGKKGFEQNWEALKSDLGGDPVVMSAAQLNSAIKERGGNYLGKMSGQDKVRWLRAHAAGDHAYAYKLEHDAAAKSNVGAGTLHKLHTTHPGSWGSPQGKAYRQVLADFLAAQPWGSKGPGEMSSDEVNAAYDALDADKTRFILGGNPSSLTEPSVHTKRVALAHFLDTRGPLPKPSYNPDDLQLKVVDDTVAPEGIDQDGWNLAVAAEKGSPEVLKLIEGIDPNEFSGAGFGITASTVAFIPDDVKALGVWASKNWTDEGTKKIKSAVRDAIAKRANDGSYVPADVPQWKDVKGKSYPLAPGTKIYKDAEGTSYVIAPDEQSGFYVTKTGQSYALYASSIETIVADSSTYKTVLAVPMTVTYEKASKDGLKADQFTWDAVETTEASDPGSITLPGVSANVPTLLYEIKNGANVPDALKANADKLPIASQMLAAYAAKTGDVATLEVLNYKLKSGHYAQVQTKPLVDPSSSFGQQILAGHVSADAIYANWSPDAYNDFADTYGIDDNGMGTFDLAEKIAEKIEELFNPEQASLTPPEVALTTLPKDLKLTKLAKTLGGMHSKQAWTDQAGNEWMSKAFPTDPNSKARVDAEHQANVIGRMFGFRNPETRVMDLNGVYSYVQHLKPATGSLSGKGPAQLSDESLAQAMEEHVLDWLVSNHDSHPDNLLTDPDGKSIIGIDKGQAWRFFPDDKLAVGYKASNPVHVWYDQFYKAVQSGSIDKKKADFVTRRVLQKALRVQDKLDAEFKKALEEAHKNRKSFPNGWSREEFIEQIVARKKGIAKDFHDFYGKLYKQAGWEYDFDLDKLSGGGKFAGHIHTGISAELADEVKKSNVHGKAVILSSDDLEDSHFLFYTEKAKNGADILRGEARLRQNADALFTAWLKSQTIANNYTSHSMNVPAVAKHAELPGNMTWWPQILAGAKTVNHHSVDGEYNTSTLAQMDAAKIQIDSELKDLKAWEAKNPTKPYEPSMAPGWSGKLVTKEQQDAYKGLLEYYSSAIDSINSAKAVAGKVTPKVSQVDYTPSAGIDTKNFIPGKAQPKGEADEVVSNVVMVAGHPVKVTKHPAYGTSGDFDPKTGVLTEKGTTTTGFYGAQYDIEVNGIKIEYRPWDEPGVLSSQKGLLKVRYEGWNGETDQMDLVFDVLREIGLQLDDADEESMELFYWKQQYGVSLDRLDNDNKYKPMQDHVKKSFTAKPDMTPSEQLAVMREAWAKVIGQDKVAKADWTPKFDKLSVTGEAGGQGKPYWLRADYSLAEYKTLSNGKPPASSSGDPKGPLKVALSGYLPTEERARIITEIYAPGGYNSQQADAKNGASGFVFTRQGKGSNFGKVYYHPSVALRTTNYAFNGDNFGDTAKRKSQAPMDLKHSTKYTSGSNELMIKNGVGYTSIAAIHFSSTADRQEALDHFKKHGVSEIHGIKIEDLFVTSPAGVDAAIKKVWDAALAEEKAIASLTPSQKAAYAALIAAGKSPAEALQEAKQL